MKIEPTKKQFENLLKLVYLGNWLTNAIHNGSKEDPLNEEFEDVQNYIFSLAKDFNCEKYIDENDAEDGIFFPTNKFEEELQEYIKDYDEECFWEELFERLSDRDFRRKYSEEEIKKMELIEFFRKEEPFREKWDEELESYGIERLEIKD